MSDPQPESEEGCRCVHAADCPLFERFKLSSVLRIWQIYYCEERFDECVRYQMDCRGEPVPPTLLPNGKDMADGKDPS